MRNAMRITRKSLMLNVELLQMQTVTEFIFMKYVFIIAFWIKLQMAEEINNYYCATVF